MKVLLNTDLFINNAINIQSSCPFNYNCKTKPLSFDSVKFSGKIKRIEVDEETSNILAHSLSTSTAGHRAPWGSKTFNFEIMKLLTLAASKYAYDKNDGKIPTVLIGGDTRKATVESLPKIKEILLNQGVNVLYLAKPVPSPLLSMVAEQSNADISILLTASHNPWIDAGFNLVTNDGAIAPLEVTSEVAKNVLEISKRKTYIEKSKKGDLLEIDPYEIYKNYLDKRNLIDWKKIKDSSVSIYYDGLKGTGSYVLPRLLKDYGIPCNNINSAKKEGPNPVDENLSELKSAVKMSKSPLKAGFSNDGDADRFSLVDENGVLISPHDAILLMIHHLKDNKKLDGAVIKSQSTSSDVSEYARLKGLDLIETPVGFKYIGSQILNKRNEGNDILVAGEESGGLTIVGHTLEKDGIIANLLMMDMIAQENKPLSQILKEQKALLSGKRKNKSINLALSNSSKKDEVMKRFERLKLQKSFGGFEIDLEKIKEHDENMRKYKKDGDGIKIFFKDGSNILVRKSGTEPKLRFYLEAKGFDEKTAQSKIELLESAIRDYIA